MNVPKPVFIEDESRQPEPRDGSTQSPPTFWQMLRNLPISEIAQAFSVIRWLSTLTLHTVKQVLRTIVGIYEISRTSYLDIKRINKLSREVNQDIVAERDYNDIMQGTKKLFEKYAEDQAWAKEKFADDQETKDLFVRTVRGVLGKALKKHQPPDSIEDMTAD